MAGTMVGWRTVAWESYVTWRSAGRRPVGGGPCGFRVRFTEAGQGPVAVGYASHFGLGGFGAERLKNDDDWHLNNWANVNYDRVIRTNGISCPKSI